MNLQDALLNWIQIKIVADERPFDGAAAETRDFFEAMLKEDHQLTRLEVASVDESYYYIEFDSGGISRKQSFPKEWVESLLTDIRANPKYFH